MLVAGEPRHAPRETLLSTIVAEPEQRRVAAAAVALSVIAFVAAAPFARMPLAPVQAFIPAYEAALVIIDMITAVLLFQQFAQLRSPAMLALAAGYLFDAMITIPHALSFPGLITPAGWLGAGSQTTAWLYMFWHGGFPGFVIAYAWLSRRAARRGAASLNAAAALWAVIGVAGLTFALTLIATEADALLPPIMAGNSYTPTMRLVVGTVWVLPAITLVVLLLSRPYSVLDL